jgi:hypothetical protein
MRLRGQPDPPEPFGWFDSDAAGHCLVEDTRRDLERARRKLGPAGSRRARHVSPAAVVTATAANGLAVDPLDAVDAVDEVLGALRYNPALAHDLARAVAESRWNGRQAGRPGDWDGDPIRGSRP